jgi:hypothetical protein
MPDFTTVRDKLSTQKKRALRALVFVRYAHSDK